MNEIDQTLKDYVSTLDNNQVEKILANLVVIKEMMNKNNQ